MKKHTGTIIIAFFSVLIILGIFYFIFRNNIDISYASADFSVKVEGENDQIYTKFNSGNVGISFSVPATVVEKHKSKNSTLYSLSDNTDLKYEVKNGGSDRGLKETIILKNQDAPKEFTFKLNLDNVGSFRRNPEDGKWSFFDKRNSQKEVFYIPAGFMKDANGKKSDNVDIEITGQEGDYTLTVKADSEWINDKSRVFPVQIDPSVVVSGGVTDTNAQYGTIQRKVAYVSGNYYAFYINSSGKPAYKKSSDSVSWGSEVTLDSDSDNYNPSVWVHGSVIYVAWIDDGAEAIEVRNIDVSNSDTQGTLCTSASQGTIGSTFMVSITVDINGLVYFAYSDTSTDTEFAVYKLVYSGCTFTSLNTGGLTASDRPEVIANGLALTMFYQPGTDLKSDRFDGTNWYTTSFSSSTDSLFSVTTDQTNLWSLTNSTTATTLDTGAYVAYNRLITGSNSGTSYSSIYCPTDENCKILAYDSTTPSGVIYFYDCNDIYCSSKTTTTIASVSSFTNVNTSLYCPTSNNCKGVFWDKSNSRITFIDCENEACSLRNTTNSIAAASASFLSRAAIDCPASNNCKVAVYNGGASILFIDCDDESCSTSTSTTLSNSAGSNGAAWVDLSCVTSTTCVVYFKNNASSGSVFSCSNETCSTTSSTATLSSFLQTYEAIDVQCISGGECIFVNMRNSTGTFVYCSTSACSSPTTTTIDANVGASNSTVSLHCLTISNCKIIYNDANANTVTFMDCNDSTCSSPSSYSIFLGSSTSNGQAVSIHCYTSTTCKMAATSSFLNVYVDFIGCNDELCGKPSNLTAPFTGQTNLGGSAISYSTGDSKLYAVELADASNQAYWKSSSASSISWSNATSYGFTAGSLAQVSLPMIIPAGNQAQVLLRQNSNLEFSNQPTNTPTPTPTPTITPRPSNANVKIQRGVTIQRGTTIQR